MGTLALAVAAACQVALVALALLAALHFLRSALAARALPRRSPPLPPLPALSDSPSLPMLTVQLPLRNERAVAVRVMRAAAALDWPADRLELQVLDDSDDQTRELVDDEAAALASAGRRVEVVRRGHRRGFKAGALAEALPRARGELLLVLDADSRPEPDLARRLAAALSADDTLAFAQARWRFDNEERSLLTRLQALILDGLMAIEQPLLSAAGLPLQFNGTAGMWRRAALERAGGWVEAPAADLPGGAAAAGASVTEDLDISFRARLLGLRGVTLPPDVAVLTELPSTMAAFRAQQQRWVRGGAEVLRGLSGRLLRGTVPARERVTMLAHLARHGRQPLLLCSAAWLPASVLGALGLPLSGAPFALVVALLLGAAAAYYGTARWRTGRSSLSALALAPLLVPLSVGMSLFLTVAFLRGFLGATRGEFVRTPKGGAYRSRRDPLALVEVAIGVGHLVAGAVALSGPAPLAGAGLVVLSAVGWLWVGLGSLRAG